MNAAVFVVEYDDSVRRELALLLSAAGYRTRAYAAAEPFLAQPPAAEPACAVLGVSLPDLSGLDLQRAMRERGDQLPVVFITGHGDVPMAVRAMKQGAEDVLTRPIRDREILEAVGRGVTRHAAALSQAAALAGLQLREASLSPREREVFALVVGGLPNKAVGAQLGVCEKTVKVHRGSVMRKMRAESLPDLVRMAERLGVRPGVDASTSGHC
jgi:FixJ family two-component response regulator